MLEYSFQPISSNKTRIIMIKAVDSTVVSQFNKIVMSGEDTPQNVNFSLKEGKTIKTATSWGTRLPTVTYSSSTNQYTITFETPVLIDKDQSFVMTLKWN